jgi:hypothetical protein
VGDPHVDGYLIHLRNEGSRQNSATTTSKHQPKGADHFGNTSFRNVHKIPFETRRKIHWSMWSFGESQTSIIDADLKGPTFLNPLAGR